MLQKMSMYRAEHEYFFSVMSELVFLVNPLEQLNRKKHSSLFNTYVNVKNLCAEQNLLCENVFTCKQFFCTRTAMQEKQSSCEC
jgi:hypothetical protein